nr:hypothetical protein [Enterovibrio nigricans]
MAELSRAGVQFYAPDKDEMALWAAKAGHQLPAWDSFKNDLAGSKAAFDKLLDAANNNDGPFVHDV